MSRNVQVGNESHEHRETERGVDGVTILLIMYRLELVTSFPFSRTRYFRI